MYRLLATFVLAASAPVASAAPPEFEKDVLPILTTQCANCHGGLKQRGELDLRTVESITKGGASGSAAVPGDLDKSVLWQKVSKDEMPKTLIKLSADEKRILKEWITAGMPHTPTWQKPAAADKAAEPKRVAERIDGHIEKQLADARLTAALSDAAEFLRRVTLDLTGRLPTPEEVRGFLDSKELDRRSKVIDQLLGRTEFGRHWGLVWHHTLVPLAEGKRTYDDGLVEWLAKSFNENRRWDAIATDLVTATGRADENPPVAFLAALKDPDKMSQRVAGVFLGVNMECAECHNHPHTQWRQKEDYWATAAFFGQVKTGSVRGKTKNSSVPTLTEGASKPEVRIPATAFAAANTTVRPNFPGIGPRPNDLTDASRKALAAWMTARENPYFAPATANRVWSHFFGRGLINPVNNLHNGSAATHPEVLALLANEFRASGFDLKHLVRSVCLSRAYQRTSRTEKENEPQEVLYGRMPVRVLAPDVLYDVLVQALEVPQITIPGYVPPGGKNPPRAATPRELFVNSFRQSDEPNLREYDHGVLQVLSLLNWKEFNTGGTVVKRLLDARTPPDKLVDDLYLRTLSRFPTAAEREKVAKFVAKQTDPQAAYCAVLWALINGSEFVFNH